MDKFKYQCIVNISVNISGDIGDNIHSTAVHLYHK